jgi:sortase A
VRAVGPETRNPYRVTADGSEAVVLPGRHSRNVRRTAARENAPAPFRRLRLFLLLFGMACVGYYSYNLVDRFIVQRYENWAFDQEISGRTAVTFADYVRDNVPFGSLLNVANVSPEPTPVTEKPAAPIPLSEGDLVGRVSIDRLRISAIIREGVTAKTLRTSVGHIPATALPGAKGNFAIAAHRDTLFRALKDIQKGDQVTVQSGSKSYTYEVLGTRIVKPSNVSVLRSDGGGLETTDAENQTAPRLLTMITCYPFYYVGSAPKRFVVQARLISETPAS